MDCQVSGFKAPQCTCRQSCTMTRSLPRTVYGMAQKWPGRCSLGHGELSKLRAIQASRDL